MIYLIDSNNKHLYDDILDQMFRQRHKVFVELFGWPLITDGIWEIDQFDNDSAVYIVCVDDNDIVLGAKRLIPSIKPNVLNTIFPKLCEGPPPSSDDTWEVSRFYVTENYEKDQYDAKGTATGELMVAMFQYALKMDIAKITCVTNINIVPGMLKANYELTPLGLPSVVHNDCLFAYAISVNEAILEHIKELKGIDSNNLYRERLFNFPIERKNSIHAVLKQGELQ